MQTNPYLLFNGNCEEAFRFYERALGAKIETVLTHEGTPAEQHVAPEFRKKVLHGRINLKGHTIMASDCPPERYAKPQGFSLTLTVQDAADAERLYHALEEGGQVGMPIQETFWAVRFGMVTDRFGIPWMINCEKARMDTTEMEECTSAVR